MSDLNPTSQPTPGPAPAPVSPAPTTAPAPAPSPVATASSPSGSRVAKAFGVVVDLGERWMIESGFGDQLASLVANTTLVRGFVLAAAASAFGAEAVQGSTAGILIGAAATVLIGTVNSALAHIRNKYNAQAQAAVGAHPDNFVGPQTVAQIRDAITAVQTLKNTTP